MRVHSQPAYVLHRRLFRDTSQVVEIFTRDHGRFAVMAKGSRGPKSRLRGVLQAFQPIVVSWVGRGEMPTLTAAEPAGIRPVDLRGRLLFKAMYINEVIMHMLPRHDVYTDLFHRYNKIVQELAITADTEWSLRLFEKHLLGELGFGMSLEHDSDTGSPISENASYAYLPDAGPVENCNGELIHGDSMGGLRIKGASLLALHCEKKPGRAQQLEIKKLMRGLINYRLGHKTIRTRELFR